jgi:hypothetical protein
MNEVFNNLSLNSLLLTLETFLPSKGYNKFNRMALGLTKRNSSFFNLRKFQDSSLHR